MNIAVYVRVSTQRQAQTQTIEQQLDSLRKYHEAQGWLWQEEHIFRDDGYSGAKLRRPGLDRLREQVGRAAFDRVIITAPDRLARNYVSPPHNLDAIALCLEFGVNAQFANMLCSSSDRSACETRDRLRNRKPIGTNLTHS